MGHLESVSEIRLKHTLVYIHPQRETEGQGE